EAKARLDADRQAAATELLSGIDNFSTPASVNLFLGKLLKNFATHRVTRRDATTLAYISQLLLNSHSVMQREARDAAAAEAQEAKRPEKIIVDVARPRLPAPHHPENDPTSGASNRTSNGGSFYP